MAKPRWRVRTKDERVALVLGKELLRKRSLTTVTAILHDSELDVVQKVAALRRLGDSERTAYKRLAKLMENNRKHGCSRKRGPKYRLSQADIIEMLDANSSPSCRWSRRNKTTFRVVNGSWRSVHARSKRIHDAWSVSHLCKQPKQWKLPYTHTAGRTDT